MTVRVIIPVLVRRALYNEGLADGMIIIWAQSNSPSQAAYGSDLSADDMQFEKEYWKPRTTFRYTQPSQMRCLSADPPL